MKTYYYTVTEDKTDNTRENSEHLSDLPDGCGCAEIWEHLSEERELNRGESEYS